MKTKHHCVTAAHIMGALLLLVSNMALADTDSSQSIDGKSTHATAAANDSADQGLTLSAGGGPSVSVTSNQTSNSNNVAHAGTSRWNYNSDSSSQDNTSSQPQLETQDFSGSDRNGSGNSGNTQTSTQSSSKKVSATASSANTLSNTTSISITNPTTVLTDTAGLADTLKSADSYTDMRFGTAQRHTWAVAAGAAALANLPQVTEAGRTMAGLSFGTSNGQTAVAAGFSHFLDDDQLLFKGGASYNSQGSWSGGLGMGFIFP